MHPDNKSTDIASAAGISPKNIDHPALRDWTMAAWLVALDVQMMRLSTPIRALYDIAQTIQSDRTALVEMPLAQGRFRAVFDKLGRAFTDDAERITQDALAGKIFTIIWGQLAHLAYNIGLKPKALRYGDPIGGIPLTQVLWAIRGAEAHGSSWMFRDFTTDKAGRDQIDILKAAGIAPIPFRAFEALNIVAPNGITVLLTSMIPIMHAMVADAIEATAKKSRQTKVRHPSKRPKTTRRKAVAKKASASRPAGRKKNARTKNPQSLSEWT